MKRATLLVLTIAASLALPPLSSAGEGFALAFDAKHGFDSSNFPKLVSTLVAAGFQVKDINSLEGLECDVLLIMGYKAPLSEGEAGELEDLVMSGKGLLIIDNPQIAHVFGVELSETEYCGLLGASLCTDVLGVPATEHPVLENVRRVSFRRPKKLLNLTESSIVVLKADKVFEDRNANYRFDKGESLEYGVPLAVVMPYSSGRLAVVSSMSFIKELIERENNTIFMMNLIWWLSKPSEALKRAKAVESMIEELLASKKSVRDVGGDVNSVEHLTSSLNSSLSAALLLISEGEAEKAIEQLEKLEERVEKASFFLAKLISLDSSIALFESELLRAESLGLNTSSLKEDLMKLKELRNEAYGNWREEDYDKASEVIDKGIRMLEELESRLKSMIEEYEKPEYRRKLVLAGIFAILAMIVVVYLIRSRREEVEVVLRPADEGTGGPPSYEGR